MFLEKKKKSERYCFRFKEKRDFYFENALKSEVVKPKTATMTPKRKKHQIYHLCVEEEAQRRSRFTILQ